MGNGVNLESLLGSYNGCNPFKKQTTNFNEQSTNFGYLGNGQVCRANSNVPIVDAQTLSKLLFKAMDKNGDELSKLFFKAMDKNGDNKISISEYQDKYIEFKEIEHGDVIRGTDPLLEQYRKEADNVFNAVSESKISYTKKDGTDAYENIITEERHNAMMKVLGKPLSVRRLEIVKKEGSDVDVFNGKTLGTLIDEVQYGADRQPKTEKPKKIDVDY